MDSALKKPIPLPHTNIVSLVTKLMCRQYPQPRALRRPSRGTFVAYSKSRFALSSSPFVAFRGDISVALKPGSRSRSSAWREHQEVSRRGDCRRRFEQTGDSSRKGLIVAIQQQLLEKMQPRF